PLHKVDEAIDVGRQVLGCEDGHDAWLVSVSAQGSLSGCMESSCSEGGDRHEHKGRIVIRASFQLDMADILKVAAGCHPLVLAYAHEMSFLCADGLPAAMVLHALVDAIHLDTI